jgi:hypothetical protein
MTKNPFDQFSKQFFEEFLSPLGEVRINFEIPGEPKFVDIWFIPSNRPTGDLSELGILASMAQNPCLIEPFRKQPTDKEIRSCLYKLYHLEAEIQRDAKRDEDVISEEELPRLWILATSCSDEILNDIPLHRDEAWPDGIYFSGKILLARIVAIDRLPRTPETLWLRILGKGLIQKQAVDEVMALPKGNNKRSAILKLLYTWKISIQVSQEFELEERELIMNLSQAYLEWEQETIERGKEIGKEQERRQLLQSLLVAHFGELDSALNAIVEPILSLPTTEYTAILLQLSSLSREDLLARFE